MDSPWPAIKAGVITWIATLAASGAKAAYDYGSSISDVVEGYLFIELARMKVVKFSGEDVIFLPDATDTGSTPTAARIMPSPEKRPGAARNHAAEERGPSV